MESPQFEPLRAVCLLKGAEVNGMVQFTQGFPNSPVRITGRVNGLKPGPHAFHVHEFGDNTSGCSTCGPHFNPFKKEHGGPNDTNRHLGDLGNMLADEKGIAVLDMTDPLISLDGPCSVVGRTMVVHADADDFGRGGHPLSKETGNSGARLACGIIGLTKYH